MAFWGHARMRFLHRHFLLSPCLLLSPHHSLSLSLSSPATLTCLLSLWLRLWVEWDGTAGLGSDLPLLPLIGGGRPGRVEAGGLLPHPFSAFGYWVHAIPGSSLLILTPSLGWFFSVYSPALTSCLAPVAVPCMRHGYSIILHIAFVEQRFFFKQAGCVLNSPLPSTSDWAFLSHSCPFSHSTNMQFFCRLLLHDFVLELFVLMAFHGVPVSPVASVSLLSLSLISGISISSIYLPWTETYLSHVQFLAFFICSGRGGGRPLVNSHPDMYLSYGNSFHLCLYLFSPFLLIMS